MRKAHNLGTERASKIGRERRKSLEGAHIDAKQVKGAFSRLSDQELAQLAARSSNAQTDFAAATLSNRDLIIILVAVAAVILIIVAVR